MRRGRRGKHHRRLDRRAWARADQPGELEAAFDELVGGGADKANELDVPPLELGEPSARSDLRLQQPDVALGEDDLRLDFLQRGALRGDVERDEIAGRARRRRRLRP